jgi:hypothetical protein
MQDKYKLVMLNVAELHYLFTKLSITVAERTAFARSSTAVVGSIPLEAWMSVLILCLYCPVCR